MVPTAHKTISTPVLTNKPYIFTIKTPPTMIKIITVAIPPVILIKAHELFHLLYSLNTAC